MTAIVGTARPWVARHWRSFLPAVVTIALSFTLAFVALAGARRTQSAYPRFLASSSASTLTVLGVPSQDDVNTAIASLPEVLTSRTTFGYTAYPLIDGSVNIAGVWPDTTGTIDGQYFDLDLFHPTSGRMADPDRADEAVVDEFAADRLGYHLGQHIDLALFTFDQLMVPNFVIDPPPPSATAHVTVVGIGLFTDQVIQNDSDRTPRLHLTPALSRQLESQASYTSQGVVLRNGDADVPAFLEHLASIVSMDNTEIRFTSVDEANALTATRPLALVVAAFGIVAAVAGLLLSCQSLGRSIRRADDDLTVLIGLGASRRLVVAVSTLAAALAVVTGTALAVMGAIAASPTMPVGPVRRVEARPGFDVDLTVLGLGSVAVVVVLVAWSARVTALDLRRRSNRRSAGVTPADGVAVRSLGALLPPAAATGVRFALGHRDRLSSRSAIASATTAVAAVVASITFAGSLSHLIRTSVDYGWGFDAAVLLGNGFDNFDESALARTMSAEGDVEAWTGAWFGADASGDVDVPLLGLEADSAIRPPIIEGRFVATDDEIVLGRITARSLDVGVGDDVVLDGGGSPRTFHVVGLAVLPAIGKVHAQHTSLGRGGIVLPSAIPGSNISMIGVPNDTTLGPNGVFVDFHDSTGAGAIARLTDATAALSGFAGISVVGVQRPAELVGAGQVRTAPLVLAGALTVGASASVLVALIGSLRRRRRELAVLTALGFTRRQRTTAMVWQSGSVLAIGGVLGFPLGIVIVRVTWTLFIDRLGIAAPIVVSWTALGVTAAGALLSAVVVAIPPARAARELDVVAALRAG